MKQFTIDGQEMAYQDVGEGPVILFGHSYLWDSQMWQPQIDALSQHYRCIVPDLWAHGESQAAPASMSNLTDYAKHLLALMDDLGIETFSIVGLSVGGMWGSELTALAPTRVKSLVLMDTFVGLEPEVAHAKYFSMLATIAELKMVPAPIVEAVVPLFFANNAKQDNSELVSSFEAKLAALSGEQAEQVARIGRMVFGRRDLCDDIEKFALPTLIAVGAEDKPRPVLESYLMNDLITGSTINVIPSAGTSAI
ncbi:beta-ketoadipate enol-lactone hydrolase [Vibrio maritimus]|uniref:Beta-ketoadipate enol-lactone hydrolase n=1 Tax=Vibrio maritimus TaxID=990268 RepID=A0A090SXX9_9VIBR|nr:beta-ketoadipate enol-lactone hydrolase [Vibrio maritimus]